MCHNSIVLLYIFYYLQLKNIGTLLISIGLLFSRWQCALWAHIFCIAEEEQVASWWADVRSEAWNKLSKLRLLCLYASKRFDAVLLRQRKVLFCNTSAHTNRGAMEKIFSQWKKQCLNKLDLSKKGSVDEDIKHVVSLLNSCEEYFTTSSCSGRIILIDGVREALHATGLRTGSRFPAQNRKFLVSERFRLKRLCSCVVNFFVIK